MPERRRENVAEGVDRVLQHRRLSLEPSSPHEGRACRVIPDYAYETARKAGDPPALVRLKQPRRDIDIGDRADAAEQREQQKAADHSEAAITVGAVGNFVVE